MPVDGNLSIADFEKMGNTIVSHVCFEAIDSFSHKEKRLPGAWAKEDSNAVVEFAKTIATRYGEDFDEGWEHLVRLFSFTSTGVFNPLCAFLGGFAAQECVKAITQKFSPVFQLFYYDATEVLPAFKVADNFGEPFEEYVSQIGVKEMQHRADGLRICIGGDLLQTIEQTKLFMVGAGAIGCELLKNYAMLGVGVGKESQEKGLKGG